MKNIQSIEDQQELERITKVLSGQFRIGKDKTINSLSEAYYVNDSSTIYANAISDQNSGHALLSLGLGAQLNGDFTINFSYDHYRSTNETFVNSFSINLRKSF